ncbi:MAG: DNA polymerase III subunit delta [Fimbriimonas sp.]|nr:DNA polymerase III subunit delta [Fimbriimonas sp.]
MNFTPEKALQHRLIMLCGDEEALRRRALDDILVAANIQKDDFDLETVAADVTDPASWYASCGTAPFLGARRTTIVRHLLRCEAEKGSSVNFAKLPEFSLLILVADDESGSEDRQKTFRNAKTNWTKAVTKAGGIVYAFDPDPKGALEAVRREVAASGKKITGPAALALVEMTGGSLSRALDELAKIHLFLGDQPVIQEQDIRDVVVASREWNVFRLVDSVFNGQIPEALRQLRVLLGSQAKPEDGVFRNLLPMVSRQLRLIWQARLCIEAKCSPSNAKPEIARMFPSKPKLSSEQPFSMNKAMSLAGRLSLPQIERCFGIVADTDARLKGALNSFSAVDTLERMILDMASVVATAESSR